MRAGSQEHQTEWEASRLALIPDEWRGKFRAQFEGIKTKGIADKLANVWLREETAAFEEIKLPLAATDEQLCDIAQKCALHCLDLWKVSTTLQTLRQNQAEYVQRWSLEPPAAFNEENNTGIQDLPAVKRMTDPLWWRRGIRKTHARLLEGHAIRLGFVHKRASSYCSHETLQRRTQQRHRNAQTLQATIARNENGQDFTLAELSSRSVANPEIRRGELMTRVAGFENTAKELDHVCEFVTVTCPSRMHPRLAESGKQNPNYDGTTPKEASRYLCGQWAQLRAKLARMDLRIYGFRVAEPHHDACPHWHMIFFCDPLLRPGISAIPRFRAMVRRYFLKDHKDELGAKARRVSFVTIDMQGGSAVGYISKYIAKNIDGFRMEDGKNGNTATENAARVEAWASTWGIRQFQQIGGPAVGLWRELRRLKAAPAKHQEPGYWIEQTRAAADDGDWSAYVAAMGGPTAQRINRPVALQYGQEETTNKQTGEITPSVGRYGDALDHVVKGIWEVVTGKVVKVMRHVWEFPARLLGRLLTPWTSVNNCTPLNDPPIRSTRQDHPPFEYRTVRPPDGNHHERPKRHIFDGLPILDTLRAGLIAPLASIRRDEGGTKA